MSALVNEVNRIVDGLAGAQLDEAGGQVVVLLALVAGAAYLPASTAT